MTTSSIHTVARGIIRVKDHFLFCTNPKASKKYLYLPGGHIENGESAKQALKRELKEETSLIFTIGAFRGVFEYQFFPKDPDLVCHTHEYNFLFEAYCDDCVPTSPVPEPEEESVQFQWVHIDDLSKHILYPEKIREWLPHLKQHAEKNDYFFSKMQ